MNRIARTALIALPLSVAALTATTGTAHADTPPANPGPIIVMPTEPDEPGPGDFTNPEPVDPDPAPVPDEKAPLPQDDPDPIPDGPGDITDTPDCTHGCDEDPEFPLGSNPGDDDGEDPDFPLSSNPGGGDDDEEPGDEDGTPEETDEVSTPQTPADSITTPTRVDAGFGTSDDSGLELSWLLAGGALVTASGAAFAARKRARSHS